MNYHNMSVDEILNYHDFDFPGGKRIRELLELMVDPADYECPECERIQSEVDTLQDRLDRIEAIVNE